MDSPAWYLVVAAINCINNDYNGFYKAFNEVVFLENNSKYLEASRRDNKETDVVDEFIDAFYAGKKNRNLSSIRSIRLVYENLMLSNDQEKKIATMIFIERMDCDEILNEIDKNTSNCKLKKIKIEAMKNIYISLAECLLSSRRDQL